MMIKRIFVWVISMTVLMTACTPNKGGSLPPSELFEGLVEAGFFEPPYMVDISEGRLSEYNVNPEDAEAFIAMEAAITASFIQLIIIDAKDGRVNSVRDAMTEHQSQLKNEAFYPQGFEAASASIVGAKGNIVYLICDERAEEIEKELLKFVA